MRVNNQEWFCPHCGSPAGTPIYFMIFCGACNKTAAWFRWRATALESMPTELPEDWDQEAAFKHVADRRGLTVEELRAELVALARAVHQKGLEE
jgi:hypothetical protein